jgi:signal transduction histidine kinase
VGRLGTLFQPVPDDALRTCDLEPSTWLYRTERGVEAWALGPNGALNPKAPPLPRVLQLRLAAGEWEPVVAGQADHGLLVVRREGPCATIVVRWPMDGGIRSHLALLTGLLLLLAVVGTTLLGWLLVLRPLLASIRALDAASQQVGRPDYAPADVDLEFQSIAQALTAAHHRIIAEHQRREHHIADVAHDLRSPLAALHLRLERMANGDPTPGIGALSDVTTLALLTENLALAGMGELRPAVGRTDVAQVAQRVADRFAALGRHLDREVIVARPDDPVWVESPPVYVAQILGNLVHTAVRHHDGAGNVAIVVEPGNPVCIQVIDDGPGTLASLPVERAEPGERHGRGLAIVRQLVAHLGGELEVRAAEPRGLVFTLRLPAAGPL